MVSCPNCLKQNANNHRFCQFCGIELPTISGAVDKDSAESLSQPTLTVPFSILNSEKSAPLEPYAPPALPETRLPQPPITRADIGQMGAGNTATVNIWGPFAGHGERGRHTAWLLDNQGSNAGRLRDKVTDRFRERQIPDARIARRTLTGKGLLIEQRPYYLVTRSVTTVGLYIAQFGQDLFLSQVTYTLGPINPARVMALAAMVLFQLFFLLGGYRAAVGNAVGGFNIFGGGLTTDFGALGWLLCCMGPFGLVNTFLLILAGLHSVYKFIAIKDPLALLRRPSNEFELDDTVALEKAVEETVRQAMDLVGLDTTKLTSATDYGLRGRLI